MLLPIANNCCYTLFKKFIIVWEHFIVILWLTRYVGLIQAILSTCSVSSNKWFNFPELQFPPLKNVLGTVCERVKNGHEYVVFNIMSTMSNSQSLLLLLICVSFMDVFYIIFLFFTIFKTILAFISFWLLNELSI